MGSEGPGNGICTNGFCSKPGIGSAYWIVVSGSVWLAFFVLDDRRCWLCCGFRDNCLPEADKRTFKNKVRSTPPFSPSNKNHFPASIFAGIYGNDFAGNRRFYANAFRSEEH